MARPKNRDGIRARRRPDGIQLVHFEEHPGHWIASPERDRVKALLWAKRNRDHLARSVEKVLTLESFAKNFYAEDSAWWILQKKLKRHYAADYLGSMRGRLKNYILPQLGSRPLKEITEAEVLTWLADLQGREGKPTGRGKAPVSNSVKNKIIDCLKNIYRYAKAGGEIENNRMESIRHLPDDGESRVPFTREELKKLFPIDRAEAEAIWQRQLWLSYFITLRDTGARPSELHALRWEDYDQEAGGFPVVNAVENTTGEIKGRTKTGSVKPIFLSKRGIQELNIWRACCPSVAGGDLVYSMDGRTPLRTETAAKHFRGALRRAMVERAGRTPYCPTPYVHHGGP